MIPAIHMLSFAGRTGALVVVKAGRGPEEGSWAGILVMSRHWAGQKLVLGDGGVPCCRLLSWMATGILVQWRTGSEREMN